MPWTGNDERARCRGGRAHRLPDRSTENATETASVRSRRLDSALSVTDDEALNRMIATDLPEHSGRGHFCSYQSPTARPGLLRQVPVLFDNSATPRRDRIRTRGGMATKAIPGNLAADPRRGAPCETCPPSPSTDQRTFSVQPGGNRDGGSRPMSTSDHASPTFTAPRHVGCPRSREEDACSVASRAPTPGFWSGTSNHKCVTSPRPLAVGRGGRISSGCLG